MKIYLLAFRGIGNLDNPEVREHGLIKVGHVGIQFDDDARVFGFSPSQQALEDAGGEAALIEKLWANEAQPGTVKDDTAIFERANELFEKALYHTKVIYLTYEIAEAEYLRIKVQVLEWYNKQEIVGWYNFPKRRGGLSDNENNCATFPRLLGISIPEDNGLMATYIRKMLEQGALRWQPK